MRDAFAVVAQLGIRLEKQPGGWRDAKALVLLVAESGPWEPAGQLADALGIDPDVQESIYHEAERNKARARGSLGAPSPNPFRRQEAIA